MRRPTRISEYALACLEAISASTDRESVSLGGAFALAHYLEYRTTNDVDAWWTDRASRESRDATVRTIEEALTRFGVVRTRRWGDVTSVELSRDEGVVFSFQIAQRSAKLAESVESPWAGIQLDTLDDLVASKMAALIERGAPRDLLDIYTLCHAGLESVENCWDLWTRRQELAGETAERARAFLAVETHLKRLALVRPLESIASETDRAAADRLRTWFREEFFHNVSD